LHNLLKIPVSIQGKVLLYLVTGLLSFLIVSILKRWFLFKISNRFFLHTSLVAAYLTIAPGILLSIIYVETLECVEYPVQIKPTWKTGINDVDLINIIDDHLIASRVYYRTKDDGTGNEPFFTKNSHSVIDKKTGETKTTQPPVAPGTNQPKFLSKTGKESHPFSLFFTIVVNRYVLAENYNGYTIELQRWYKNIRSPHNTHHSIRILQNGKLIKTHHIYDFSDYTSDQESIYLLVTATLYRFDFSEMISKPEGRI